MQNQKKLNSVHVIFLMMNTVTGVGLITFPHDVSQVGYGMWVMPLVYGIVIQLFFFLFFKLLKSYPNHTLFQINTLLLGKVAGNFINFMIFIYAILVIFRVIKTYVHILSILSLPSNPTFWLVTALLFVTFSIVSKGNIISLAQYHILSFYLSIWIILFLLTGFNKGDITHLLPLFNFTAPDLIASFPKGYFSFIGFEFILFFYPFINNQEKAFKHSSIALWVMVLLYCFVTIATIVHYTDWELQHTKFPMINYMQEMKFSFVVRIDNFFINLWLLLVLGTTATYIWIAKNALNQITRNEKNEKTKILSGLGVVFILLFLPGNSGEAVGKIADGLIYANVVLAIFPLFLLVIRRLKS
ncbi:GerAB/ArcD/ProY family transporter [Peribacillus muralis]|uniref:GerAB/ArcD/ProY family transporter n=1 Tax=Peribacillus muralis TaxID=264697 RepID=UPI001F4E2E6A|nr:GerAB/ArcD/ProY family transporter [Peribacillus muralis]MCK1992089.1 spore germination protein [Peribacillus muralis]MCK2012645.1 spore germination protein [Peribacillus muralis]